MNLFPAQRSLRLPALLHPWCENVLSKLEFVSTAHLEAPAPNDEAFGCCSR